MSDLGRLRDEADAFELDLLASARGDGIPPRARGAVLAGLGASMAVSLASAPATGAITGGASLGATSAAGANAARAGAFAKWIALSIVGSALLVAAAFPFMRGHREARVVPSTAASTTTIPVETSTLAPSVPSPSASTQPTTPLESSEAKPPTVRPLRAPSVTAKPAATGSSSAETTSTADEPIDASSLAAELRLIERARASLRAGRADDALAALDEHHAQFARGVLSEEAAVLRIEAHVKRGEAATASRLATAFLAARPHSPYAPRVRRALIARDGEVAK